MEERELKTYGGSDELRIPYDVIELPSQGITYPNKKSSVKVEYLTTYDENILGSQNLAANGKLLDVLIQQKVKDLGFDPLDMLEGDRIAVLIFLRATGLGQKYQQPVIDPKTNKVVLGEIDLSQLKTKKLEIKPDEKGEFDYITESGVNFKFKLLTGRDYREIDTQDKNLMSRMKEDEKFSQEITLELERQVMEINGERDKLKISRQIKILPPKDTRELRNYIKQIQPGLDFNCQATTPGGESVSTFLRIGGNFF
jgi:hypothetical protein